MIDNQVYIPLFDADFSGRQFNCEELRSSMDGFKLILNDIFSNKITIIAKHVIAFRVIEESDAMLSLHQISIQNVSGRYFYEIGNSDFLAWINCQNFSARHQTETLRHFAIYSDNEIIDIITYDELEFRGLYDL